MRCSARTPRAPVSVLSRALAARPLGARVSVAFIGVRAGGATHLARDGSVLFSASHGAAVSYSPTTRAARHRPRFPWNARAYSPPSAPRASSTLYGRGDVLRGFRTFARRRAPDLQAPLFLLLPAGIAGTGVQMRMESDATWRRGRAAPDGACRLRTVAPRAPSSPADMTGVSLR
ncbi:hypothetical protein C8J57DRAFT_1574162 [Mycena rebaudengoi]|nr:hypothetical protein C8J57DRAFT_1574162 [Mycena rebaudengoi]